jgi:uncharacterized protein (DUF4415 family)
MAATESDIRLMLARRREEEKPKPEKPRSKAGTKMALDILNHFKFPGDGQEPKGGKKKK